jgi:hypothetical protein
MNLFQNIETQLFFNENGYVVLDVLTPKEIDDLTEFFYNSNLISAQKSGFSVSMDHESYEINKANRDHIFNTILPKLDVHLTNFKPYVASYVNKSPSDTSWVPLHQDWSFVDNEDQGFQSVTCWTALVDTTIENGCMTVIPKSHKILKEHRPSPSPQTPAPLGPLMFELFPYSQPIFMKAGQTLFFDNRTFHASGPNFSKEDRLAVGIGITQSSANLIHYYLKPNNRLDTLLKYSVDTDFFISYNNARLSSLYNDNLTPTAIPCLGEVTFEPKVIDKESLIRHLEKNGLYYNPALDFSCKAKEQEKEIENESPLETVKEIPTPFFRIYTPKNIAKEIALRLGIYHKIWQK